MVTYEKFMKWLEATLNAAVTRSETKHSVGVTESKLEEHKVSSYISNVYWSFINRLNELPYSRPYMEGVCLYAKDCFELCHIYEIVKTFTYIIIKSSRIDK